MAWSAFETFYRANYELVLRYVSRRVADPETAKEVAAECFVTAWRKFDAAAPFGIPWLYRVARNHLGNAYQKRERERMLLDAIRQEAAVLADSAELLEVSEALAVLAEGDREALRLTYWEQLPASDVAIVLGCSEAAAWKRISRARANFRTAYLRLAAEGREL